MNRSKYELRRARQPHRCTECSGDITVKTVYLFTAMAPEHDFNQSQRVWIMRKVCPGCITRKGWTVPERKSRADKRL